MVESHFEHWDGLIFRDYLILHPENAEEYRRLKIGLAARHARDRITYTRGKAGFIAEVLAHAKRAAAPG
jgi:GrpB-like predicted nucleotidyltransferase (UPF0157 family)